MLTSNVSTSTSGVMTSLDIPAFKQTRATDNPHPRFEQILVRSARTDRREWAVESDPSTCSAIGAVSEWVREIGERKVEVTVYSSAAELEAARARWGELKPQRRESPRPSSTKIPREPAGDDDLPALEDDLPALEDDGDEDAGALDLVYEV